jgi:hypothetical protein
MGVLTARAGGLAAALLCLAGCALDTTAPAPNLYALRFQELWRRYDLVYPLFEAKQVDWQARRDEFRARAQGLRSQAELVSLASELLAPLHDPNIWFTRPDGGRVAVEPPATASNLDLAVRATYLARGDWHPRSGDWGWARFGEVGYLALDGFDPARLPLLGVSDAIDSLADTRALIVDIRANGGGSPLLADSLAGRFVEFAARYGFADYRVGDTGHALQRYVQWVVPWTDRPHYAHPVIVLIGPGSAGSAVRFALAMAAGPFALLLGDTTAACGTFPDQAGLGEGWSYTIPTGALFTPDRQPIDGVGLAPDVRVGAGPADFARGSDPVLDSALVRAGVAGR